MVQWTDPDVHQPIEEILVDAYGEDEQPQIVRRTLDDLLDPSVVATNHRRAWSSWCEWHGDQIHTVEPAGRSATVAQAAHDVWENMVRGLDDLPVNT